MNAVANMRGRFERVLERARRPQTPDWKGRKFVVYGAGNFGREVAATLAKTSHEVLGFIDRQGKGQVIAGLPVHNLQSTTVQSWLRENPVVFVGIHSPGVSAAEIAKELRLAGFAQVFTPVEYHPFFQEQLGPRYWLGNREVYNACASEIDAVSKCFADDKSAELFWATVLYRLGVGSDLIGNVTGPELQYADPTLPRWKEPLRLIDAGAFIGDTLTGFLRNGYAIETAHAFEPDLANFRLLKDEIGKLGLTGRIVLWPCGIWDRTERLSFSEGAGAASKIAHAAKADQVPVVALDDVLHNEPINLIKMDVEGAELRALDGARKILMAQRPALAVCVYHEPQHLWSIARWIGDLNLSYQFYLRAHQHNGFDTVLYALPK